jgi:hypothetical protein
MQNFNLIKRLLSTYANSVETSIFIDNVALLIQCIPEEHRENAIAIITGDAELTVRPINMVEVTCNDKNYTIVEIQSADPNFLRGTVNVRIKYTKMEIRWYKTEEDAANEVNRRSYKDEEYTIARPYKYESDTEINFSLAEWNTGKVIWRR